MTRSKAAREIIIPEGSPLKEEDYRLFLEKAYHLLARHPQYFAPGENIDCLELAHLIPGVPETVLAIYVSINDAVCNKGLVTPFLLRHEHNNVFAFDPDVYPGGDDVPGGTIDVKQAVNGFEPPNRTWDPDWTYVVIADPSRTPASLWRENGYIDMIAAKLEDFTLLSDTRSSKVCFFVDPKALEHPVNKGREYLKQAVKRGERTVHQFSIPEGIAGETDGLVPLVLERGEKLYIATPDFSPCQHAWSNIHPDNTELAVVNENSAIPPDLVAAKPPVKAKFAGDLKPATGSADLTTDRFYRGNLVERKPLLRGLVKG